MKKSIGILAAVLFSASVYSQRAFPGARDGSSGNPETDKQLAPQAETERLRELNPSEPQITAPFDVQPTLRSNSIEDSKSTEGQGWTLSDKEAADTLRNSGANQGSTLSDSEAANALRKADDPDLANKNQQLERQERGLLDDGAPDAIYEEWILITPPDVGAPGESESGSSSSKIEVPPVELGHGQLDNYRGAVGEAVGAPTQTESGKFKMKDHDECDLEGKGSAQSYESESSSSSSKDHEQGRTEQKYPPVLERSETDRRQTDVPAIPDL